MTIGKNKSTGENRRFWSRIERVAEHVRAAPEFHLLYGEQDQDMTELKGIPFINVNGTSPGQLLEDLIDALEAVRAAQDKLRVTAPHGRDYPSKPLVFEQAQWEHVNRFKKLEEVRLELESLAAMIDLATRDEIDAGNEETNMTERFSVNAHHLGQKITICLGMFESLAGAREAANHYHQKHGSSSDTVETSIWKSVVLKEETTGGTA